MSESRLPDARNCSPEMVYSREALRTNSHMLCDFRNGSGWNPLG